VTALSDRTINLLVRDRTRFGVGAIDDLAAVVREIGGGPDARAFIVSDPGVVASGVTATVAGILAEDGIETAVFGDVEPNPGLGVVERGGAALRAFGLDDVIVVAVGGGSSMDTAKVLSLYATNDVGVADLGYENEDIAPGRPILAVPTTAGTGAETNIFGVITDEATGRKTYIGHRSVMPRACVLDPELTLGLPAAATGATGIDAMTHSLESLLSRNPNPFAEAIALAVIRTVGEWLPRAVADGSDIEARSQMLVASHLAGLGQASGTGVGSSMRSATRSARAGGCPTGRLSPPSCRRSWPSTSTSGRANSPSWAWPWASPRRQTGRPRPHVPPSPGSWRSCGPLTSARRSASWAWTRP